MNYDWNWYFSSFSQSAAALIGIIGAFLISRLLGFSEKINGIISNFDNLTIEYDQVRSKISYRRFIWYTKRQIENNSDLRTSIKKGEFENVPASEILNRVYKSVKGIYKNDFAVLETFNEMFVKYRPDKDRMLSMPMEIPTTGLWESLRDEKEKINQLEIEAKSLVQFFKHNLQDLNAYNKSIRPLKVIILLLMMAFVLTVLYPLDFMPMPVGFEPRITFNIDIIIKNIFTLKFLTLITFFCVIEGLFAYFLYLTWKLEKQLGIAIENHKTDYRTIKSYSEYFNEN